MITRERLERRRALLERDLEQSRAYLAKAQANINAIEGAIQDCDFWLGEIVQAEAEDCQPCETAPAPIPLPKKAGVKRNGAHAEGV